MGHPFQIVEEIGDVLVEVDHGLIPSLLHQIAEGVGHGGEGGAVHPVCAGGTAGDVLPVEDHGPGNITALQQVQDEPGLLLRLLRGDSLGEKVNAHFQPGLRGPLNIGPALGILKNRAAVQPVIPATGPDHGKVDAVSCHRLPVDLPLVRGDIHAKGSRHAVGGIGHPVIRQHEFF